MKVMVVLVIMRVLFKYKQIKCSRPKRYYITVAQNRYNLYLYIEALCCEENFCIHTLKGIETIRFEVYQISNHMSWQSDSQSSNKRNFANLHI